MVYRALDQPGLAFNPVLNRVGPRHDKTASHTALACLIEQAGVIAISKAVSERHLPENLQAAAITLMQNDIDELARHFAAPQHKRCWQCAELLPCNIAPFKASLQGDDAVKAGKEPCSRSYLHLQSLLVPTAG